jgi:hypothetical protein
MGRAVETEDSEENDRRYGNIEREDVEYFEG